MRILFIVHRFHTNLYFPIKSLILKGHQVEMFVPKITEYEMLIEDHTFIKPQKIESSKLTVKKIYILLKKMKPDLILQRHFENRWVLFSLISLLLGIKRVTYNQGPYLNNDLIKIYLRPFFKRLFKGRPINRITPVKGINGSTKEPFSTYIPFPIENLVDEKQRQYIPKKIIRVLCIGKLGQERKKHLLLFS